MKRFKGSVVLALAVLVTAGLHQWSARAGEEMPLSAMDYVQIEQLYARYNHHVDSGKDEGRAFADLFTADGVLDTGSRGLGEVRGTDALAALARAVGSAAPAVKASHYAVNVMIDPSPEGATGSAYVLMISSPEPGKSVTGPSLVYTDTLVRTPGGWKFRTRTVKPIAPGK